MRRLLSGLAKGVLALSAGSAFGGDGPPPLSPPVLGPPVSVDEPPGELPLPVEATPLPGPSSRPIENRPMLVIPGVNTPRPGTRYRSDDVPSPIELPPAIVRPRPGTAADPRGLPPIIESDGQPRVEPLSEDDPEPEPPKAVRRPSPAPPSRRPPGLFGKLFPQLRQGGASEVSTVPSRVESESDPAADAELQRRIERQIEQGLGERLRTFDVRVVGRDVTIRAETLRFWQRRGVRGSLESLQGLRGYRVKVLVDQ